MDVFQPDRPQHILQRLGERHDGEALRCEVLRDGTLPRFLVPHQTYDALHFSLRFVSAA